MLLIKDEKTQIYIFELARVCTQIIWKSSGSGIYIQLPFYIETSLI